MVVLEVLWVVFCAVLAVMAVAAGFVSDSH